MHDLETVAIRHRHGAVSRARHDFQISFHRDLGGIEPQAFQQAFHRQAGADAAVLAIQGYVKGHRQGHGQLAYMGLALCARSHYKA